MIFLASVLGFLITLQTAEASELNAKGEVGYQGSAGLESAETSKSLLYIQPSLKYSNETIQINAVVRGLLNTQDYGDSKAWHAEGSVRELSVSATQNHWKLVAGFQQIVWGETFGVPILD